MRRRTVLWTAGVEAVPFARRIAKVLEAKSDHAGRIAVEADLSVPGHPEIFVIGDLVGRDNLPGVAENAMQGGIHAAACIRRDLAGKPRPHYRYRDLGSAAYISRGHALLQAGPVKLSGFIGWLGWGLIHIAFLTGVENRVSTVATWLATIARARRTDRTFILGSTTSPEHPYTWLKFVHPNMLDATASFRRGDAHALKRGGTLQPLRWAGEAQSVFVSRHVVCRNLLVDATFEQETKHRVVRVIGLVESQQRGAVRLLLEPVIPLGARPERPADRHISRQFVDAGLGDRFPRSGLPA